MKKLFFLLFLLIVNPLHAHTKTYDFTYQLEVPARKDDKQAELFVPIASSDSLQKVTDIKVSSTIKADEKNGAFKLEDVYGNHYWHLILDDKDKASRTITFHYPEVWCHQLLHLPTL